jgi:hypothetical protein
MIREDYVGFETAKLLKEKGFDWECRAFWKEWDGKITLCHCGSSHVFEHCHNSMLEGYNDDSELNVTAPTLQMAIKWLKEEHNLGVIPHWSQVSGEFGCRIYDLTKKGSQEYHSIRGSFEGFEEPAELGIKYCLENLI